MAVNAALGGKAIIDIKTYTSRYMPAHLECRHSPYSIEQLFDLVADVEKYSEFLPWIHSCRIVERWPDKVSVDMALGLGPLKQNFHSRAVLERPHRIEISSDDPPFEWFRQRWQFAADAAGAVIEYSYDFRLHSQLLEHISSTLLDEGVRATIDAFEQRARHVYGDRGSNPTHRDAAAAAGFLQH